MEQNFYFLFTVHICYYCSIHYKNTNYLPERVPKKYKIQLDLYKKLLEKIYKNKKINCYILWTSFGKIEYVS